MCLDVSMKECRRLELNGEMYCCRILLLLLLLLLKQTLDCSICSKLFVILLGRSHGGSLSVWCVVSQQYVYIY